MTSTTQVSKVVKVTKDKKTNIVTVNNIQPAPIKLITLTSTTSKVDSYGNVATITTDKKSIVKSVEIRAVMKTISKTKPQLAVYAPLSSRSVTLGENIENTVILGT